MLTAVVEAWLEERGIDPEVAAKLGVAASRNAGGGEEVAFPYLVGESHISSKHRTIIDKRFRQSPTGCQQVFWNYNAIVDPTLADQPLIITEGEVDALTAIQCGFVRTVSVPGGAPQEQIGGEASRKYAFLEHARAGLREVKEIILATDSDGPGQALQGDLALRLGRAKCKWVRYPKGCKDLNDTLMTYGERGVQEVFKRASWCAVNGLYKMSELPPYADKQCFSTGMPWLDDHYKVRMGDFCVITGVPGHGKSTFVNDLTCRLAKSYGWRIAIASFEQHPQSDHRRNLRGWFLGGPSELFSDVEIAEADRWIDEHFVFIVPSDDDLANLEWTLDAAASAVIRYGVRLVVIDPWNELDHSRPADLTLTEYTGKAIKEFKRLATSLDIHMIVVAHPTKLPPGNQPTLYSISDSAHWANKPDVGMVIWKGDPENDFAEVRVVKSRYHDQIGRPGTVQTRYNSVTRQFEYSPFPVENAGGQA